MRATAGTIGPYVLGAEVGRGASGIVHAATDSKLGSDGVVKVLDFGLAKPVRAELSDSSELAGD